MSGRIELKGLQELSTFFATAADDIREDGMAVVRETTEAAAGEVRRTYPEQSHTATGTGTLARRVRTMYPASSVLAGVVLSTAPHSHLYEFGTRRRQTSRGANRGVMPKRAVTVPIAERYRASMVDKLKAVIRRFGFVVE